jgi:hypothetical protein
VPGAVAKLEINSRLKTDDRTPVGKCHTAVMTVSHAPALPVTEEGGVWSVGPVLTELVQLLSRTGWSSGLGAHTHNHLCLASSFSPSLEHSTKVSLNRATATHESSDVYSDIY